MKHLKQFWTWINSFEILFINFEYPINLNGIPSYYLDNNLSDKQKLQKDYQMVCNDFRKIIK